MHRFTFHSKGTQNEFNREKENPNWTNKTWKKKNSIIQISCFMRLVKANNECLVCVCDACVLFFSIRCSVEVPFVASIWITYDTTKRQTSEIETWLVIVTWTKAILKNKKISGKVFFFCCRSLVSFVRKKFRKTAVWLVFRFISIQFNWKWIYVRAQFSLAYSILYATHVDGIRLIMRLKNSLYHYKCLMWDERLLSSPKKKILQ